MLSSFLPAERPAESTKKPCDFEASRTQDASDRLLPSERLTCTRTSRVPGSLRGFRRVDVPGVLGSEERDRGTGCFHDIPDRFGGSQLLGHALPLPLFDLAPLGERERIERGRFLPTAPIAIEPLTPLSLLSRSAPRALGPRCTRVSCQGRRRHSLVKRERLVTTRDAFRRQGPFLGTSAFLQPWVPRPPPSAFGESRPPPNDVLTSLWASAGPSPEHRAPTKADASDDPFRAYVAG